MSFPLVGNLSSLFVIPGLTRNPGPLYLWIPAFAGMTNKKGLRTYLPDRQASRDDKYEALIFPYFAFCIFHFELQLKED